jgi:four helix bundle protein
MQEYRNAGIKVINRGLTFQGSVGLTLKKMKENIILDKSFELAKEIVFLYQYLSREKHEYVLSKQVLRSGTSVGANIAEGIAGQSRRDFSNRLSIAYKESRETEFWLKLLCATGYLTNEKAGQSMMICDEVIRILCAILKTTSENNPNPNNR